MWGRQKHDGRCMMLGAREKKRVITKSKQCEKMRREGIKAVVELHLTIVLRRRVNTAHVKKTTL